MKYSIEQNEHEDHTGPYLLVPKRWLEDISQQQDRILNILSGAEPRVPTARRPKEVLADYISETDARELLGRKAGWFWNLRKTGQLKYSKTGRSIYYKRSDIVNLLDKDYKQRNG